MKIFAIGFIIVLSITSFADTADTTDTAIEELVEEARADLLADMVAPTNLTMVNSIYSDFAPYVSADGQRLYFSSNRRNGIEDFYVSEFQSNRWQTPTPLGAPINTDANEGSMAVSVDGNTIIFTACGRKDAYGTCDLYISERVAEGWSEPRNLGRNVNSRGWDGHPSLSADGKTLFFSSDRFGGFGGRDIWLSRKTDRGWSRAENIGFPINNARDQASPFIHPDGVTLYFSSAGHGGLGMLDVFKSEMDSLGRWSEPLNLGPPVNTPDSDYFFSIPAKGDLIFFSSDRAGGYGGFDIYYLPLSEALRPKVVATLSGSVSDKETGLPLSAEITVERIATGEVLASPRTNPETGEFFIVLPAGETYGISVSAEGYAFSSERYDIPVEEGYQELKMDFKLSRLVAGETFEIRNIFFDFDSDSIRSESIPELNRAVKLLEDNPSLQIEIRGHTDAIGAEEYNIDLSHRRAFNVLKYLVENGIEVRRLAAKGYGTSEPIGDNITEEGRRLNRRTEFHIIED
ncbi:MAG TPA: hypothetical protein ENN07_03630 [candidate division Zixibacteria bacterium]|nr:hypothetical protein [candidate division Zixibacteria bacterium]